MQCRAAGTRLNLTLFVSLYIAAGTSELTGDEGRVHVCNDSLKHGEYRASLDILPQLFGLLDNC